jgi:hypothetical protein
MKSLGVGALGFAIPSPATTGKMAVSPSRLQAFFPISRLLTWAAQLENRLSPRC